MLSRVGRQVSRRFSEIAFKSFGNPSSVCSLNNETTTRAVGFHDVEVDVKASEVSSEDVRSILGLNTHHKPGVGGHSAVGMVKSVGSGVSKVSPSDPVLVISHGTWTSRVVAPQTSVFKIPTIPFEQAASIASVVSAWAILKDCANISSGDVVLHHNAGTAVDQALIQLGKSFGFKVLSFSDSEILSNAHEKAVAAAGSVKLAISGESGKISRNLTKSLSHGATLVLRRASVSAGEEEGFNMPVVSAIFQDVVVRGFDLNAWAEARPAAVERGLEEIAGLVKAKALAPFKSVVHTSKDFGSALSAADGGIHVIAF